MCLILEFLVGIPTKTRGCLAIFAYFITMLDISQKRVLGNCTPVSGLQAPNDVPKRQGEAK
ncbi:hypothetical protein FYZ44_04490 [Mobiluncus mulieris]|nr:hypothetical protein [Mobiluncus mulieris]